MEPRRDDGDDVATTGQPGATSRPPQWSPVVTTGTTDHRPSGHVGHRWAAMEPRRDDGDDDAQPQDYVIRLDAPQWSPVVTTGTTARRIRAA